MRESRVEVRRPERHQHGDAHVAGAAAIALGRKPLMGPFQTRSLMEQTAIPLGPIDDFGRGLVQADRVAVLFTTPFAAEVPGPTRTARSPRSVR
jgi:hypothetical protein